MIEKVTYTSLFSLMFRWKALLQDDQRHFISPTYSKKFASYADVFVRLRPYHLTYDENMTREDVQKCEWFLQYLNLQDCNP